MTFKSMLIASTALVSMGSSVAYADAFDDAIIANLTELGYERIEIAHGLSQIKVEAGRGSEKLEVIYDSVTGEILYQEHDDDGDDDDDGAEIGVEVEHVARNFLDQDGREIDDDDDEDEDEEDEDEEDDRDDDDEDDRDDDDDDDDDDEDDDDDDEDDDDDDEDDDDDDDDEDDDDG